MESGSPYAKYVLATRKDNELWHINHIQVPYPWEEAARIARINHREDYAMAIESGMM
jgi:hypothetical protein